MTQSDEPTVAEIEAALRHHDEPVVEALEDTDAAAESFADDTTSPRLRSADAGPDPLTPLFQEPPTREE